MNLYLSRYKISIEWTTKNEEFISQREKLRQLEAEHKKRFETQSCSVSYISGKKVTGEFFLEIIYTVYYHLFTNCNNNEQIINSILHDILQCVDTDNIKFNISHSERIQV